VRDRKRRSKPRHQPLRIAIAAALGRLRGTIGGHAPDGQRLFACSANFIAAFIPHLHRFRTRWQLPLSRRIDLRDLERASVGDRDRKHRRLVLFQFKLDTRLRHDCSDSCHHEFDRVRLLKTFGSRSEKTLPRGFRPATAKAPQYHWAFIARRRDMTHAAFGNALTQRINSQFLHNSRRHKAD
jgi:hypothetical protein